MMLICCSSLLRSIWLIHLVQFLLHLTCAFEDPTNLPFDPSLVFLYGNSRYTVRTNSTEPNNLCESEPVYIDYTFEHNSYVVICPNANKAQVRIFPIDSNNKHRLSADHVIFRKLENAHQSNFALDWIHGLLYFTEERSVYIVDLKQKIPEEMLIYSSNNSAVISGLVVRPEQAKLVWMEFYKQDTATEFMQGDQDGQNVVHITRKKPANLENLAYDYLTDRYIALIIRINRDRTCWIFSHNNFTHPEEHTIQLAGKDVNQVILFNNTLIFEAYEANNDILLNNVIYYWPLTQTNFSVLTTSPHKTGDIAPIFVNTRPNKGKLCDDSMCKQQSDFCIPKTSTSFVCSSNLNLVYDNGQGSILRRNKWLYIVIVIAVVLGVLVFGLLFITLSKKKVRFYQIRLKSINRVNSAKLEPKPDATNEVAD